MQFFCRAVFAFFDKAEKVFLQRLPRQFRDGLVSEGWHQISFAQPLVFFYGAFLAGFLLDVQPFLGAVVIVGLGIATALTGGTAGVILGAAFWGATTGAIGGGLISGTIGAITGGAQGFLDGFVDGFMWGAVIGGITGALTSGINIATGAVKIAGSAQKTGTFFHRMASNIQAGKMAMQIGRYSQITLDRSLNRAGLIGRKMPDVIGTARWGKNLLVEVTSKSQTNLQMAIIAIIAMIILQESAEREILTSRSLCA